MYALLDSIKAERQSEATDTDNHASTSASERNGSESQGPQAAPVELDTDVRGEVPSIQLSSDTESGESPEKPLVRRVRLPGASQRTSSLKLRRRT